jgi:hypothetical protein
MFGSILDRYRRYLGPLAQIGARTGHNKTAHVATIGVEVDGKIVPTRCVVKMFHASDCRWFNELFAWLYGRAVGVSVPPCATVLYGSANDIREIDCPELTQGVEGVTTPMILWCTSEISPKSKIQTSVSKGWSEVILSRQDGKTLAAFDSTIGNFDRIAENVVFWTAGGGELVAVDHEDAALAQDWTISPIDLIDERASRVFTHPTQLLHWVEATMKSATGKGAKGRKAALESLLSECYHISEQDHPGGWGNVRNEVANFACASFNLSAAQRLLDFVDHRVTPGSRNARFGFFV